MPTAPKVPQDHKPKASTLDDVDDCFSFDHDGKTYTLAPTADHMTPGFIRKHRNTNEADVTYSLIEELADAETLDVIDNMSWSEHSKFHEALGEYINAFMGASTGESSASSMR